MPWRPLTIVVARLMVSLSLALPTSRLSVALRTMRLPRSTSCTAGAEALAVAPPLDGAPAAGAAASLPPPAAAPPAALSPPALHPAASSVATANASAAATRLLFISTPSSTRSASIGRWSRPVRFPGAHRRTAAAAPSTAHLRNSDLGQQGIAGDAQAHKDRGPTLSKSLPTPQLQLRDRVRAEVPEQQSVQVTISHQEDVRALEGQPGEGQARQAALASLEHQVHELQAPVLAVLAEIGIEPDRQHVLTNAVTATLTPAQIRQVAELDEVKLVRLESFDQVTTMNESVEVIEAREVWDQLGFNGHGTHTAGTVASNDPIYRGVAWQADLINIKVLTAGGSGQPQSVIDGLDQAVRRNALVASLSLGWSEIAHGWVCNDADCILCQAADNAVRLGVTVVVAAGNEGNQAADPANAGKSNIRHPGAARRVVTVGAVDKAKVLAWFSSIGPGAARLSPGSAIRWTKPDVSGPGVSIVSSVLGGGFAALSGTSMATPHVAGVAALILQRFPDASPMMVKKHLEDTSEVLPYAPNEAGYGLVNAFGAMIHTLTVK